MSKIDILRVPDYLEHIFEAIERIHLYIEDISEVAFLEDKKTQKFATYMKILLSHWGRSQLTSARTGGDRAKADDF